MYRLKKGVEVFTPVDGPAAGKTFAKDRTYTEAEIPAGYKDRFEPVKAPAKAAEKKQDDKPKTRSKKK